ncbi:MAG: hypothetical protein JNL58_06425 [Planctomyces sp.]|nr:hypothetical protein [Planctomyces sp.]
MSLFSIMDVIVQHHERQLTVTIQWMAVVIVENRLPFPVLQAAPGSCLEGNSARSVQ